MNTFNLQRGAGAQFWAVLTAFAVLLSAFSAPLSVFAQEPLVVDSVEAGTSTAVGVQASEQTEQKKDENTEGVFGFAAAAAVVSPDVKLSITKIVCPDESMLPNDGYSEITSDTAGAFLAEHTSCYLGKDFKFQYAFGGVQNADAPDNTGALGAPWMTTNATDAHGNVEVAIPQADLANASTISVREVWNDSYIPFTGSNGDNASAEIYCANDAANFDNLEWISGVAVDHTYNCVAWNVPAKPAPVSCEFTMISDAQDLVVEKSAYAKLLTPPFHVSWVSGISGSLAKWIWGDDPVNLPTTVPETQTFKKSFNWSGLTVDSAVLTLASDNSHAITLGSFTGGDAGEFNYSSTKNYNVAAAIATGTNTLSVEVKNFALTPSDASTNPAGLLYELKIKGTGTTENCGQVVPLVPETPKVSEVTMCKVDANNKPLAGWQLALVGEEVDSLAVPADGVTKSMTAVPAGDYVLKASGTYGYGNGGLFSDARFSERNPSETIYAGPYVPWVNTNSFVPSKKDFLSLQVNADGAITWGSVYNPAHVYYGSLHQLAAGNVDFAILDDIYGDNSGTISVSLNAGRTGITGENGCVTFANVPFDNYDVEELLQQGWVNVSGLDKVDVASTTETFTVVNRPIVVPTDPVATVIAHKIVCTDEAELPNWGATDGHEISSTTAATWVAEHDSCSLEAGWEFEWAPQGTANPDNLLPATPLFGVASGTWTKFGPTDVSGKTQVQLTAAQIAGMSNIWMREVLKTGYIPFTSGPGNFTNADDVTAEMYCHTDAYNYDNYDRVDGIAVGNTYDCVAWNHAVKTDEPVDPAPKCDLELNLVTNGSFEADTVTDANLWQRFVSVVSWLTTKVSDNATTTQELHKGWSGNQAADGLQYAELDGDVSSMVSQDIVTVPGYTYELLWSFAPRQDITADQNQLNVLVNGGLVAQNGPALGVAPLASTDWLNATTSFVATGTSTKITFADNGPSDTYGTFVDNVQAYCVTDSNDDGNGDPIITDPTPAVTSGGSNGGGRLLRRDVEPAGTVAGISTGAGGDFVTPDPKGLVLGDQVSAVPYGAPGTGHGGASTAPTVFTLSQLLVGGRRTTVAK